MSIVNIFQNLGAAMSALRLTRFFAAAALALSGLLVIAGPASAQPGYGAGGITVSLSASASGGSITATGNGVGAGEAVTGTVFSDPVDLGTKSADGSGEVSFMFSVQDLAPGEHMVVLSGPSGSASATFTVTAGVQGDVAAVDGGSSAGGGASVRDVLLALTGLNAIITLSILGLLLVAGGGAAVVNNRRSRNRV